MNTRKSKRKENDEFYTQLSDFENEFHQCIEHFLGKEVRGNYEDILVSNCFHFISYPSSDWV